MCRGRAMEIVENQADLEDYASCSESITRTSCFGRSLLVGKECEVDAICDGKTVLIPGIMEHIERAGVHSGIQWRSIHRKIFRMN